MSSSSNLSRHRGFIFVVQNYTNDNEVFLKELSCSYMVYGREVAPTTNTPHLQGYVYFKDVRTESAARKALHKGCPDCHVEVAGGSAQQNRTYSTKDGNYIETGIIPMDNKRKGESGGEAEQERWKNAKDLALEGKLDEIDADIYIRCYSTLKMIKRDHMAKVEDLSDVCGVWIHGPAGCGKSRYARSKHPDAFLKPINKWFDGYNNEDVCILDDVDPTHAKWIGYFIKMWTDRYAFIGECKGTSVRIRPKVFVITSQYSIDQIWEDDESRAAVSRRCKVVKDFSNPIELAFAMGEIAK